MNRLNMKIIIKCAMIVLLAIPFYLYGVHMRVSGVAEADLPSPTLMPTESITDAPTATPAPTSEAPTLPPTETETPTPPAETETPDPLPSPVQTIADTPSASMVINDA